MLNLFKTIKESLSSVKKRGNQSFGVNPILGWANL